MYNVFFLELVLVQTCFLSYPHLLFEFAGLNRNTSTMLSDDEFDFDNFRIGSAFELYVLHDPGEEMDCITIQQLQMILALFNPLIFFYS